MAKILLPPRRAAAGPAHHEADEEAQRDTTAVDAKHEATTPDKAAQHEAAEEPERTQMATRGGTS